MGNQSCVCGAARRIVTAAGKHKVLTAFFLIRKRDRRGVMLQLCMTIALRIRREILELQRRRLRRNRKSTGHLLNNSTCLLE
jgi:hypothetical protein